MPTKTQRSERERRKFKTLEVLGGLRPFALAAYESAAESRYREALRRSSGRGSKFRAGSEPSLAERMESYCARLDAVAAELREASLSGRLHESCGRGLSLVAAKLADVTFLTADVVVGEGVSDCWVRAVALKLGDRRD